MDALDDGGHEGLQRHCVLCHAGILPNQAKVQPRAPDWILQHLHRVHGEDEDEVRGQDGILTQQGVELFEVTPKAPYILQHSVQRLRAGDCSQHSRHHLGSRILEGEHLPHGGKWRAWEAASIASDASSERRRRPFDHVREQLPWCEVCLDPALNILAHI